MKITPEQVAEHPELAGLAVPRLNAFIPHDPTENPKQGAFLVCDSLEAAYGGAAGGGKSDALLMAALQYVDVPGYSALLLRRTYQDLALPGALMDRASEWLRPTEARWNQTDREWTFPSGSTLTFGYVNHPGDERRYGSAEFQFIGIDELGEWPDESQYRFLFSRLRRLQGFPVPLRMRSAFNPIGPGAGWIRRRFLDEGARGRIFIPALLWDNAFVDREAYLASLDLLDPITRAALLEGKWIEAGAGAYFQRRNFTEIGEADLPRDRRGIPETLEEVRYWDLAATEAVPGIAEDPDWTAGVRLARDPRSGIWIIRDIKRARLAPGGVEQLIRRTAEEDGRAIEVWIEQEPGAAGKSVISYYSRHVLPGWGVYGGPSSGSKEERAKPVSAQVANGNVFLLRGPWLSEFYDEAEAFPEGGHDDQVDALSGAFAVLADRAGAWGEGPRIWR